MTKESTDLINWIQFRILYLQNSYKGSSDDDKYDFNKQCTKAIELLEKVKEVELQLKLGGFIQDPYKNICKNGDEVLFRESADGIYEKGKLRWNPSEGAFLIDPEEGIGNYLWEIADWHKA